jgi:hypothetical protein
MRMAKRLEALAMVVVAGALVLSGGPAMAAASSAPAYTCTGGVFPFDMGSTRCCRGAGRFQVPCDLAMRSTTTPCGPPRAIAQDREPK